ncbi:hypothetical protein LTR57_015145 [Friedmanniomyces endolithicus]|nr:hypothetical protein LTR57_015145 [Friedmanniomyces endolithicus]
MRFTSRTTTTTATPDHAVQFARGGGTAAEPPQKAELFFGARTRLGRKKNVKGGAPWESDEQQQRQQQGKNLGAEPWAQDRGLDTTQSPLEEMPDRRAKLNVWPNLERDNRSTPDVSNGQLYSASTRPGIPPRRTSSNAVSDYYNPSKQPYYVSQQTSDSAVRDMGLRKPPPMTIHETASDPALARRPLKSALKKHFQPEMKRQASDTSQRLGTSSSEKKPTRLNLSHFLPRSQSRNLLSPNTLSRSPSALTDNSDYSPRETVHVQLKRPTANAPFTTHKSVNQPTVDSSPTTRAKVFEPDIYDQAKTNVRRPPKGIQNWFDGVDISTDEESETETKKQSSPDPHELDANDLSSDFSPWHIKSDGEQPRLDRKGSRDLVEDNLLAIKHARERIQERMRLVGQRKGSFDTVTIASAVSSEVPDRKRGGGSRLALVELAWQSVLSLSESSGDEGASTPDARAYIDDASLLAMASNAPSEHPPQRLQSKRSIPSESVPRQSTSTVQTSGSIPIRLTDSIPLPVSAPPAPDPKRAPRTTTTAHSDPTAQALRKLTGQATPRSSRSRRSTAAPKPSVPADSTDETLGSPGAETTTTSNSVTPSDPSSHLMAVSEEEMILLEMMRNKRAAMQSSSFAEGYQLALKREQELMVKRRESAQQTALKILRLREEGGGTGNTSSSNKLRSQRGSKALTAVGDDGSGAVEDGRWRRKYEQRGSKTVADPMDDDGEAVVDEGYRRKYSALRKEEVDGALKLEKFLADGGAKTPTAEDFPEAPGFGIEPPGHTIQRTAGTEAKGAGYERLRPLRATREIELLMPRVYDPSPSSPISPNDDAGSSPAPGEEDIETQHDQVRQLLAGTLGGGGMGGFGWAAGEGGFPRPPSAGAGRNTSANSVRERERERGKVGAGSRREKRRSLLAPSPVVEEEVGGVSLPEESRPRGHHHQRQHQHHEHQHDEDVEIESRQQRRRSVSGRRLSAHQFDFDALLLGPEQRVPAIPAPAPLKQASGRESKNLGRKRSQKRDYDQDLPHHNDRYNSDRDHNRFHDQAQHTHSHQQQPYKLTPNFDFSPLDFPSPSHLIVSPSRPKTPLVAPPPPPPLSSSTLSSSGKPSTLDTTAGAGAASSSEEAGSLRRFNGFGFGFGGARAWTPDTEVSGVASASASASASVSAAAEVSGGLLAMAAPASSSSRRKEKRERGDAVAAAAPPAPAALMPRKKGPPPRLENLDVLPDLPVKRSTSRPHGFPLHGSGAVNGGIGGVDSATAPLTTASEDVLAAWAELGGGGTEGLLGNRRRVKGAR